MSSILTALQKLAEEKQRGERDIAFPAGSLSRPDRQLYDKRKSTWARVYAPVVMLMLLAGGWFGRAYFKEADMPLTSQARKEAPPAQHWEQSAERPSNLAGAAEPVLAGNEPVEAGSMLQHPKPGKAAIATLAEPRPVAREEERSPEQATTATAPSLAPKAEARTQTPADEAGAGSDESIPILHNAPLKVQALVWSTNPRKRIAVINNLVLKEGDDIESFQVLRIDPDAIIVNADGHLSQVRFGSK
jgi:hypothetical protein